MNWIKLREAADGRVLCSAGNKPFVPVDVRPCFPLSGGGEQVALIGEDGGEVATLESPKGLEKSGEIRARFQ